MAAPRTLLITTLAVWAAMTVLSYEWPQARSTPLVAAPDPDVTCAPSKLDLRVIAYSDGRSFRFDWEALRAILEQPRLHLLAERQLRSGDRTGQEPCRAVRCRSAPPLRSADGLGRCRRRVTGRSN
jgi:hypothetical protein